MENIASISEESAAAAEEVTASAELVNTTMEDDKLWEVPGFNDLIKYVIEHNLKDTIVEFVVFNHNVGVNNEKVLIVELRSDY